MKTWQRFVYISFSLALIMNAALWLGVMWWLPRTNEILILHYNIYLGPDVFGAWYQLFSLPGSGLAAIAANGVLAWWWRRGGSFLSIILSVVTIGVQIILAVGFGLILSINHLL